MKGVVTRKIIVVFLGFFLFFSFLFILLAMRQIVRKQKQNTLDV